MVEAYLRARNHFSLTANIRGESAAAVARLINQAGDAAGLRGPTVARVYPRDGSTGGEEWFAVTVIVSETLLLTAVNALRRAGASEISSTQVRYMFQHRSQQYELLKRQLDGVEEDGRADALANTIAWSSS